MCITGDLIRIQILIQWAGVQAASRGLRYVSNKLPGDVDTVTP